MGSGPRGFLVLIPSPLGGEGQGEGEKFLGPDAEVARAALFH